MRYTQPQSGPVQIDWSNPLARGPVFAFTPAGSSNKGAQQANTYTAGVALSVGAAGVAMDIASASAQNGLTVAGGLDLSLQSGGCTLIVVCDGITPGVGGSQGFIGVSNSNFFGYNAGGFPLITVGSAIQATSSVALSATDINVIAYSYLRGQIAKIHLNGVLVASVTPAAVGIDYLPTLLGHVQAVSTHGRHRIYGAALFSRRVLDDSSVASISANPWQLFKSPQRVMLAAVGGGGDATGILTSTLANAIMAASGITLNAGAFASTLDNATMTASGSASASPSGALASTLADTTMSASGSTTDVGTFATTLSGATMAAAGMITNSGAFAAQLAGASMAAAGSVAPNITGTFSSTLDDATMAAYGYNGVPPVLAGFFQRLPKNPRHIQRIP